MNTKNKEKRLTTKSVSLTERQLDMIEEIRLQKGFSTFTMVVVSAIAYYYDNFIDTKVHE